MSSQSISRATSFAIALLALSGAAFAAGGSVTSVSATPSVFPGESIKMTVGITQGSYSVDCNMHWSLKNAANLEVKGGNHKMQADATSMEFVAGFAAPEPGIYTLEATSGPSDSQTVSCQGKATAAVTVKDKNAISTTPVVMTLTPAKPPVLGGHVVVPVQRNR